MSSKLSITATFIVGIAVGAAMVYLSPPANTVAPNMGSRVGPQEFGSPGDGVAMGADGQPLPSAGDAEGPPVGPEHAPANDAVGPPSTEASAGQAAGTRPLDWVEQHVVDAGPFWLGQASQWSQLGNPALEPLIEDARMLAESVPQMGELAPPLPEVVVLVSNELGLYDRAKAHGLDVSDIELELADFLKGRL